MTREVRKLKAIQINSLPPGTHSDGGNLLLRVRESGSRSWVFRYKQNGRAIELGLGSTNDRTLAEARDAANDMRRAIARGQSPKEALRVEKPSKTFAEYARECIEHKKAGWRNSKHASQWTNTLEQYAFPFIGDKSIIDIGVDDVKSVLNPIWKGKTETASRVRQRIEVVLDYAFLHEDIDKSNPARWKGCLDHIFAAPKKVSPVVHFNAIPYTKLSDVMQALRAKTSMSAYCVRWIVLTACRSSEARGMTWEEIDMTSKTWIIPPSRMKSGREHRVPLNDECIEILIALDQFKSVGAGMVFLHKLSDVAASKALKIISYPEATIHGLRSSFRDWCGDNTNFSREVCEAALAHAVQNQTEAAYRRSDLFEKRRDLMMQWGKYLYNSNV
ncbi:MAG: integrase arm-type DNA-binding domain-containing protein [Nitrosomonas sp.]|uniref:tyrosine-type recombinase/integrase n=1 Tax=Pseudomonadati TaxID=3379134 RepID=UPI00272864AB|nr:MULTISPECIES: integrase arm-type DNA-binding domain-containing protein [Bacteria]MDO8995736.1 integrase arm-type DNA-binding domain-containing protein [Sediminibacterium sp.]MDP3664458.1 integrase arm-type DNA-binding domain-containing protein [Nitrosomonas sp.]MDZ4104741.1 integrase arm-type DNA-binding domain-containing protein [Nitrosomonas sp.]